MADGIKKEFQGKHVLIAGLGKSGKAALEALLRVGALPAVFDDRDIEADDPAFFEKLKRCAVGLFLNGKPVPDEVWDMLALSPGIPPWIPFIEKARDRGTEIIGELELAFRLGRGKYAAITGTNGKTTTTTLVYEIFSAAGLKTVVCGNIGMPVVTEAIDATDDTWLITEVSSFQLETTARFRPKIAAILNLTPDHLDRHKTMASYAAAKARVFAAQETQDFLIYNIDDEQVRSMVKAARSQKIPFSRTRVLDTGVFVQDGRIVFADARCGRFTDVAGVDELLIPGKHNLENALAGTAVALAAGVDPADIAHTLRSFEGVEHRLELVLTAGGVRFVNDSKGTNPDASIKALEASGEAILMIAGGYDKAADFTAYVRAAKGRVKKWILLGATADRIRETARAEGFPESDIAFVSDMNEAVSLAAGLARPGDTVLLSPACASWDMYTDYEARGRHFKEIVRTLRNGTGDGQ